MILCLNTAFAEESIFNYISTIEVDNNSDLIITEDITVNAEGNKIRRGIYRDFPTDYKDQLGHRYVVGFRILDIQRDGYKEKYHTEKLSNGIRIYMGDKNVFLSPGEHSYKLKFLTNRQLGFFKDHDELYFNAIGLGWIFPIKNAEVRISLPEDIKHDSFRLSGFTGGYGSKEQNFTVDKSPYSNFIRYKLTKPLGPHEGFTVLVGFEKGKIIEPGLLQKIKYFISDNNNIFIGSLGFIAALIYYLVAWNFVGKDPDKGAIFPQWEIPSGLSAAEVRYLHKMQFDKKAFSALITELAVKGCLKIEYSEISKSYTLVRQPYDQDASSVQKNILNSLFQASDTIAIKQENYQEIRDALNILEADLKARHLKRTFYSNAGFIFPAVFIMFLTFFLEWVTAGYDGRNLFSVGVFVIFFMFVVLHYLFRYLLKAPTIAGRKLMDKIEGLKMYMSIAEKESLAKFKQLNEMPKLYEKFLPYAVALGVESQWGERFSSAFQKLSEEGHAYRPVWYSNNSYRDGIFDLNGFSSGFSGAFTSSISSSTVPPGSKSGFGDGGYSGGGGDFSCGGSSGGGGGGGGGGGW